MKHISLFKTLLSAILIGILFTGTAQVRIISGFQGGSYYQMATDIEKTLPQKTSLDTVWLQGYNGDSAILKTSKVPFVKVYTSKGAQHNFSMMLREEKAFISFMQFDVLYEEQLKDIKKYKKRTDSIRVLMPLGFEEIHLITLKDNKIKDLSDLKGKRVAVGAATQGTAVTARIIKEKTGIKWEDVQISFRDALHALMTDKIDAFFFVGSSPVKDLNGLSPAYKKLTFVPIKDKALDEIYTKTTIPANTYNWQDKDVETYAVRLLLVVDITKETPEDVKDFKKFLTELQNKIGDLQEDGHPNWKKVDFNFGDLKWEPHEISKEVFGL